MKKLTSLILSLFFYIPVFGSGILVGNGGEGVVLGSSIFSRDLFEYSYNHPGSYFLGTVSDYRIEKKLRYWSGLNLSLDTKKILIQKVSDIERFRPLLGQYLAQAILFYDWSFVDSDLRGGSTGDGRTESDLKIVPVANRFMSSIFVNRFYFSKMDPINQVALILHEVMYATMKLQYESGLMHESSDSLVRFYTASLFNHSLHGGLRQTIDSFLTLPPISGTPRLVFSFLPTFSFSERMICISWDCSNEFDNLQFIYFNIRNKADLKTKNKSMEHICKDLLLSQGIRRPLRIVVSRSSIYKLSPHIRKNQHAVSQVQLEVEVYPELSLSKTYLSEADLMESCPRDIDSFLGSILYLDRQMERGD